MSRLRQFQSARDRLMESRNAEFKPRRAVRVINERYHGFGLIVHDETCPLDQIAVRLENGNTWWYPLDDCSLASRDSCPQWLQKLIQVESKSVVKRLAIQRQDHQ